VDYVDTSVLASYYFPDSGSDLAQKVLLHSPKPTVSALTQVELSCALARKVRDQSLSKEHARRILTLFEEHVRTPYFQLLPVRSRNFLQARKWLSRFSSPLRVLDALHLAVAHEHGCRLLTSDRDLAAAAKHFRVRCRLIA